MLLTFESADTLPETFHSAVFSLPGIALIFYFLSFWFCKPTIQEDEEKSKHQQLSNDEDLDNNENGVVTFESAM